MHKHKKFRFDISDEELIKETLETRHIISTHSHYLKTLEFVQKNNNEITFFIDRQGTSPTWGPKPDSESNEESDSESDEESKDNSINATSISDTLNYWIEDQIWKLDRLLNVNFKKVNNRDDAILKIIHTNEDIPNAKEAYGSAWTFHEGTKTNLEILLKTSSIGAADNFHKTAVIHEIGHCLTLEHPFESRDGDVYGGEKTTNGEDTVMAYGSRTGTYPAWYKDIDLQALCEVWGVEKPRIFEYNFRDYNFYKIDNGYGIKLKEGINTIDEITGIQNLKFADQQTNLIADIKGVFDQITGLNNDSGKIFRLYSAAFARFPDADGLKYWTGKYTSGENSLQAIAQSFLISEEFIERYGENVTNAQYVETLYVNVLGRGYDQDGYNYWLGSLNAGTESRNELLLGFSESAENKLLFTDMTGFS